MYQHLMGLLPDIEIERLCQTAHPMISPFHKGKTPGTISKGLTSFGYDISLAPTFYVFDPSTTGKPLVDPKDFKPSCVKAIKAENHFTLEPHSFALACSVEEMNIPSDVMVVCVGKSTYARCGLIVNVTPLEPGWRGFITLELSNTTPLPVRVYVGEGIAQLLFFRSVFPEQDYASKNGKYQNQNGITLPRI